MGHGIVVGKRTANGYRPSLLHRLLKPRITGNAINGLGETQRRRARPIYHWAELKFPHKRVWKLFLYLETRPPAMKRAVQEAIRLFYKPAAPVATAQVHHSPEIRARQVKEFALEHEADVVGIARLDQSWVFEGLAVTEPWVIVMGVQMNYENLSTAPQMTAGLEVLNQYNRGHRAATALADWIRGQGWDARGFGAPFASPVLIIPAAIAAGLGQLGKHGSLINRKLGSSLRLAYVLTEMPLVADAPDFIGVDEFCTNCQLCTTQCPPDAIGDSKQMVRGELKWYVDFDKCVPFFNDNYGCAICLAVCPWSRPGVADLLTTKMLNKIARAGKSDVPRNPSDG